MININDTVITQYANSSVICELIDRMNEWIDPHNDIQLFYDNIFNVATANSRGLDIWGVIVDLKRTMSVPNDDAAFGFDSGLDDWNPFNQAPFVGEVTYSEYRLEDEAYRALIMCKAMANIVYATAPYINQMITLLFKDRGRAYFRTLGNMHARYTFEFQLEPFEKVIVQNILPRPSGVFIDYYDVDANTTFGFSQSVNLQPFNQGVFS